jgi:hypothetical protein
MSPDHIFLGLFVGIVPAAAVVFGLVSFGIIASGKPRPPPDEPPESKEIAARKHRPGDAKD